MKILFLTFNYPTPEDPVRGVFVREHARAADLAGPAPADSSRFRRLPAD